MSRDLVITHWVDATPEVLEAFRSSFRKLGRVLNVNTENR